MEMNYDEKELHRLEGELHTEILPGTEIMTDTRGHHFVKGGGSRVLVPQPSPTDPHDPLNWSPFWKGCAITAASYATFTQGFGPLALAPMFTEYIEDFHTTLAGAVQFTGVSILVLGFSNFFWVPVSTTLGRRPAYILSQIINVGAAIWRARAQTYGSFMGACVLNGFAAGPGETLQPAVIADIFFLHDRGKWNTLYWVVYFGALMVAPILSGPMAQYSGWRNFWWLYTAMLILSVIMIVFMFPETRYHRLHPDELARKASNSLRATASESSDVTARTENSDATGKTESSGAMATFQSNTGTTRTESSDDTAKTERDPYLGVGKPSRQQFGLYQPNPNILKALVLGLITPWKLFLFPIVQFSALVVSMSAGGFLIINLTQEQVFGFPPYNYSGLVVGFFNFAILGGAFVGLAVAGPFSDWVAMKLTIKNKGVREPEMRLPAMIPFVLVMIIGNVVLALGYENRWSWAPIVIVGYGFAGLQVAALPAIASTYAVDCYKPVAGPLFVAATVDKNLWGYGMARFITPWTESAGYELPVLVNMALIIIWSSFGIVFYYYGKTFRRWTKNSKVHSL